MKQTTLREQFLQCMERKKAEKEKPVDPIEISETAKESVAPEPKPKPEPEPEPKPEPKPKAPKPVRRRRRKILDDDDD